MEWADATVWKTVLTSDAAKADDKVRDCFYHLHLVQRGFLRAWRGEPLEGPLPTFNDLQSLIEWARTFYGEAMTYLGTLSDGKAAEELSVPWASIVEQRLGRAPEKTTIGETVLQVVLHSQYHRGQVNARLRSLGLEPPLVDYIAWIWLGRPKAVWVPEA
jgi:uncharacterized damage-inducible protein DinB